MIREKLYDVIERPVVTEKSTIAAEMGKYIFKIFPSATKSQVKQAIEAIFEVKVDKINIINIDGKTKRFKGVKGRRADIKKAVVTLKKGESIDIAGGMK